MDARFRLGEQPRKVSEQAPTLQRWRGPWGSLQRHRAACGARSRAAVDGEDSAWVQQGSFSGIPHTSGGRLGPQVSITST